jgi:hypothetical protein
MSIGARRMDIPAVPMEATDELEGAIVVSASALTDHGDRWYQRSSRPSIFLSVIFSMSWRFLRLLSCEEGRLLNLIDALRVTSRAGRCEPGVVPL